MFEYSVYGHYDIDGNLKYIGSGKGNRPWVFHQRSKVWHECFCDYNPIVHIFECNISLEDAKEMEKELINSVTNAGYQLLNINSEDKGWLENKAAEKTIKDRSGENHPLYGTKRSQETIDKMLATKTKNNSFAAYWTGKNRDPELIAKLTKAGHSPEARAKRAEKMRGRKLSAEHRAKISEAGKNRLHSEESKAKISASKKGKPNGLKGRVMPEDHRRKISEASKGKKMPREGVEKWRKAMTGRPSPKRKKLKCLDNGVIYDCAKLAAEELSLNEKSVQRVCSGERKTTGGYRFAYVE